MDYWTESPLNKAHFYERKANAYANRYMYDEAIECHSFACLELDKSLKCTDNLKARLSIELQYEYHRKQKEFLKSKKLHYETYKDSVKVQKEAMMRIMKNCGTKETECENNSKGATLKAAIFKTIEEADSMLELLVQKDEGLEVMKTNQSELLPLAIACGSKKSKDDRTVIEELKIVNFQLRSLITEVMSQLTAKEVEVKALGERVAQLEAENAKLRVQAGYCSAHSSPFLLSPTDEILRTPMTELPALAPLELPDFDLSKLHNKISESKKS